MQDWSAAIGMLCKARRLIVLGQGAGLAIAQEAAARFRAHCALQTEALACAELCRSPMAQAEAAAAPDTAVLAFALRGPGQRELIELAAVLRQHGTPVLLVAPSNVRDRDLTLSTPPHRDLEAITTMQSLYLLLEAVSQARRDDRTVRSA
jgi:glucosamine--fructose-6-phosphate aminotransferase (isomerizing)